MEQHHAADRAADRLAHLVDDVDRRRLVIDDVAIQRVAAQHLATDDAVRRFVIGQARPHSETTRSAVHSTSSNAAARLVDIAQRPHRGDQRHRDATQASSPMIASAPNDASARLSAMSSDA